MPVEVRATGDGSANRHQHPHVFLPALRQPACAPIAQVRLSSSNVGPDEDWFGSAAAISGDTIMVDAQAEDAAYIFVRDAQPFASGAVRAMVRPE
jgi:hypothetical protein